MRYLHFPLYCRGGSGFSNLVMSFELGVVASFLLDRALVIEGNVTPPANVVKYPGSRVTNRHRARVTDLLHLPVPWIEAERVDYDASQAAVLSQGNPASAVFVWPPDRDLDTDDFRYFARDRKRTVAEGPEQRRAPVVRLFPSTPEGHEMANLGFYSYFFYLDPPTRRVVENLLHEMKPQAPYAELAAKVSRDLGCFNAVHARRGDFKQTFGTTTRDRNPEEMIRVLDQSFGRDELLVILTDERDDSFFREVTACFRKSLFIDHHILEHYAEEFFELPLHDSIALAYLSQLVAAEAQDFVGTMTSTYTSLVQRFRGNRGRPERFKFLWNELPDPGVVVDQRGSHPPSDCVPLHPDGSLVEEGDGPYTWNRVNPRINPAWQREWPESFLSPETGSDSVFAALRAGFHARREAEAAVERATAPARADTDSNVATLERPRQRDLREQRSQTQVSDPTPTSTLVEVSVHLIGGRSFRTRLSADSEVLVELFQALAAGTAGAPPSEPRLLQVPIDGGQAAYSFPSGQLQALETCPPVLIDAMVTQPQEAAAAPAQREAAEQPQPAERPHPAEQPQPAAEPEATEAKAPEAPKPKRRGAPVVREPATRKRRVAPPQDFDPLPFVQVTDFLTPDEQRLLLERALAAREDFLPVDGTAYAVARAFETSLAERIARRLRLLLGNVLPEFDVKNRSVAPEALRLSAHRHGDVLAGSDAREAAKGPDEITCIYFFHKEPRPHSGGEVRLRKGEFLHVVEPRNNAVMIHPTSALEEVLELRVPTGEFEDSRFQVSVRI